MKVKRKKSREGNLQWILPLVPMFQSTPFINNTKILLLIRQNLGKQVVYKENT